jgi:peptide/nickel transport system permease protein
MVRFVARRLVYLVPVWIGISLVAFVLANLTPGDPARLALQRELGRQPTAVETAAAREQMGLDDPAPVRYVRWLGDAVTGDLGTSYRTGNPVLASLADRFPTTLQIAGGGLLLAILIAIPLGILAAVYQRGPLDHLSRVLALVGASMPSYWVAYLLILLL